MKKNTVLTRILTLIAATAILSGCSSTPEENAMEPTDPQLRDSRFADAPDWIATPRIEGGIAAVGSAAPTRAGFQFQRTRAQANARDELTRQLNLEVANLFKDFAQVTGVTDRETVDTVASNVTRQVAVATISGSKQINTWQAPDKELFVLMALTEDQIAQATKDGLREAVRTSRNQQDALYQQFLSKRAQKQLDREIEKRFGNAGAAQPEEN
jgi:uncharacterized lipoprotein YajG